MGNFRLARFAGQLGRDAIRLYRKHLHANLTRERIFLASISFFLTFAGVRAITHAIRAGVGPFHNVSAGGTHIHHLVWGILLLLLSGYLALFEVGRVPWLRHLVPVLFGVGAALTLDEFALWFFLADVYWSRQGRDSVDAVILFGSLLTIAGVGRPFFEELTRAASDALWRNVS